MTSRALALAAKGIGQVSPSPLVGCVIVDVNGEIVGEGAYIYENVTHAEVIALTEAGERAKNGTAYVSLEPHDHFGRTPPCTEALIAAGIRRVVCPTEDPNPLVSGNGFAHLRRAGIEVANGILKREADKLNEKFCHWHKANRPFVHLKLAQSVDGRISLDRTVSTGLTSAEARAAVQDLRHEYDAILIGGNTAAVDNPNLTDRSGKKRRRPLVRVVLDNSLQIIASNNLIETAAQIPTIVFTNNRNPEKIELLQSKRVEVVQSESGGRDLRAVLHELKKRDLQSVLVEGGTTIAGAFVDARLVDKFSFFVAPLVVGGERAPVAIGGAGANSLSAATKLKNVEIKSHGADIEITGYPAKDEQ